ncbi:MAG TPA: DNA translocase FtsK 4TM domain-containing protein [Xanthobacteraceae bacterium]|nr:DNA translocase FtsK 4TM domain-containing protein [Xanthobacteraceae bacterium]
MSAMWRSFEAPQLSDDLREAVKRRLRELGGLAMLSLATALALALATWSAQDPSLTHATNAPIRNLAGFPGAVASDLMMQIFGLASLMVVAPVAVWGWRLISRRAIDREKLRLCAWILGVAAAAAFASALPPSANWPLPTGLGGVLGDTLLRLPAWVFGSPLGGSTRTAVAATAGLLTLVCLFAALGFGRSAPVATEVDDDDNESEAVGDEERGRGWFLGWLAHAALSIRARGARLLSGLIAILFSREDPFDLPRGKTRGERIEPRWREAPPVELAADPEDREEEQEDEEEAAPRARSAARKAAKPAPRARRIHDGYELPSLNLLSVPKPNDRVSLSQEQLQSNATALEGVLSDFGVRGEIINVRPGPVVTLYELEPAPGIKSSRVIGLADDIARSMSALSARVAVVSGRNAIGIELPNPRREKVLLREILSSKDYTECAAKLPLCLGKNIGGEPVVVDLARMPHLLIAGTTGSGKSVGINTMILSIVYRLKPDQCRLIMIDPKMLELSVYDGIPHLLTPVVTDPKKAVTALKWAVREMEDRYRKMSKLGVRNLDGYNARVAEAKAKGETLTRTVHTGYDKETGEAIYEEETLDLEPLPFIVVIVDEMADLMMVAGKDIEGAIQRLAQMARAAGIHVILATQRPSVDVITGTIKANFPTRISFQVTSKIDSRTILGEQGAEQLLGQGDMLYMAGGGRIIRVHGPFVSDEEVEKVVRHLKSQGQPQYLDAVTASTDEEDEGAVFDATAMGQDGSGDLFQQAVQIVLRDRKASTSYIQRRLQIGYNKAASLMERMEKEGIVGQANHAGKREILVGGEDA